MIQNLDRSDTRFLQLINDSILVFQVFLLQLKIRNLLHLLVEGSHLLCFFALLSLTRFQFVIERGGIPPASGQRYGDKAGSQHGLSPDIVLWLCLTSFRTRQEVDAYHRSPTALKANPTPTAAIGASSAKVVASKSHADVSTSPNGLAVSTTACIRSRNCCSSPATCAPPPHNNTRCTSASGIVDLK